MLEEQSFGDSQSSTTPKLRTNTDEKLWVSFKLVWKQLRFSLVHHKRNRLESKEEFYQVFYESAYFLWLENALVSDTERRLEHTCLLVYFWYCLIQTYRESGLSGNCPQIAISVKVINAIVNHLAKTEDSGMIKDVKFAKICLKKLKNDYSFNYSLEIGVKTFNLTLNLNPRS